MIVDKLDNETISDLDTVKQNFDCKDMGKLFAALTTYVYKDPVKSVSIELAQNAYDSHVVAKKTEIPFEVHLPTNFEPYYSIRDFGVSMSDDFMLNQYCMVFESTKKNNYECGGWGIGRLSAVALQDTYNITCYLDGIKRDYIVFKEGGRPQINKITEEQTTEENGVLVSVNVGLDKINEFRTVAQEIYSFFPTIPTFIGYKPTINKPEYLIEGKNWGVLKGYDSSRVLMGIYTYSIDIQSLGKLSDKERSFLAQGIHLKFNIDDVSVSLSRDGLHYNNKTINKIKSALSELITEYEDLVKKNLEGLNSKLKAFCKLKDINNKFGNNLYLDIKWNGHTLFDNSYYKPLKFTFDKEKVKTFIVNDKYSRYRGEYAPILIEFYLEEGIKSSNVKFYYDDLGKGNNSLRWRFTEIMDKERHNYDSRCAHFLFKFSKVEDWAQFIIDNKLETDDFILLSSLKETKVETDTDTSDRIKNDKHSLKNNFFSYNGTQKTYGWRNKFKNSDSWDIINSDDLDEIDDEEMPYVRLDRFVPSYNTGVIHYDIDQYQDIIKSFGCDKKIIGIKAAYQKDLSEKWLPVDKFIIKLAEKESIDDDELEKLTIKNLFQEYEYRFIADILNVKTSELDDKQFFLNCLKTKENTKLAAIKKFDLKSSERLNKIRETSIQKIKKIKEQINKKYPYHNSINYDEKFLKHYIKLENIAAEKQIKEVEKELTS